MSNAHPAYPQTVEWLFAQLPMFTRDGAAAYKADLTNTIALCDALGNPQNQFRCIHVAGTNGKGSTSSAIAAFLQQAGHKTGLYTSPHLVDFRERIRINGAMVSQTFVVDFTRRIQHLVAAIKPSFFELMVAMAFEWFAQQKVDFAVIETGLGGRLDSTNVIHPLLSVITNIALDHTALLGNTLPEIAAEKAGIIKPETPVIIGERHPETEAVFLQKAAQEHAPVCFAEDIWKVETTSPVAETPVGYKAHNQKDGWEVVFASSLTGKYQQQNLATVFAVVDALTKMGMGVNVNDAPQALQNLALQGLHGRYEVLQKQPLIVADVAHNPQGLEAVLKQWNSEVLGRKHVVLGFVKDKDVASALALFPKDAVYYFCQAAIPRALPVAELKSLANNLGLIGEAYDTVTAAFKAAKDSLHKIDSLLITGSFFIVGETMEAINS